MSLAVSLAGSSDGLEKREVDICTAGGARQECISMRLSKRRLLRFSFNLIGEAKIYLKLQHILCSVLGRSKMKTLKFVQSVSIYMFKLLILISAVNNSI